MQKSKRSFEAFTLRYNGLINVIQTEILIAKPYRREIKEKIELSRYVRCKGIWDTGATQTSIDETIAKQLDLEVTGEQKVLTANGKALSKKYMIEGYLPTCQAKIDIMEVTSGKLGDNIVLIGMDLISIGDFAITNKGGKTAFSFRFPSQQTIDFFPDFVRHHYDRNDLCPCGSQQKVKRCHGRTGL
jgi:hypothetical protein